MAGLAHMGVGLAAKRAAPQIPVAVLLIGAYVIDIIWGVFYFAGVEQYPGASINSAAPWSHGLFMSVIWSVGAALMARLISRSTSTGVIFGILVFSHWVVDFIAKPMSFAFPSDSGMPLLFNGSPEVGLGLYSSQAGVNIGEYGTLALGFVIYIFTVLKLRKEKKSL
ncbi:hypothetical protein ACOBQJ_11290 [Pelotomaculum propionicicum]|uniref:hypothetical protein n=1 Tax=Pelotomaculum propionicicum TaxID=258475 RepID=UPI003B7D9EF4